MSELTDNKIREFRGKFVIEVPQIDGTIKHYLVKTDLSPVEFKDLEQWLIQTFYEVEQNALEVQSKADDKAIEILKKRIRQLELKGNK